MRKTVEIYTIHVKVTVRNKQTKNVRKMAKIHEITENVDFAE